MFPQYAYIPAHSAQGIQFLYILTSCFLIFW